MDVLTPLHKRDQAILKWLRYDGKLTATQLAKRTGLTKDTVAYRLRRLTEKGILARRYAYPDYAGLGYLSFRTYIKLQHTTPSIESQIARAIRALPGMRIMGRMQGEFSYGWITLAKTPGEFDTILRGLLEHFSPYIQHKQVGIMTQEIALAPWAPTPDLILYPQRSDNGPIPHDDKDRVILQKLYRNADIPKHELARLTGLSITAVRERIKRMEKTLLIRRYRQDMKLKRTYYKLMINLEDINKLPKVHAFAKRHNEYVQYLFHALGGADIELDVFVPSFSDLLHLIDKLKETLKDGLKNYAYHTFSHLDIPEELELP